jgi:hypothetical protein
VVPPSLPTVIATLPLSFTIPDATPPEPPPPDQTYPAKPLPPEPPPPTATTKAKPDEDVDVYVWDEVIVSTPGEENVLEILEADNVIVTTVLLPLLATAAKDDAVEFNERFNPPVEVVPVARIDPSAAKKKNVTFTLEIQAIVYVPGANVCAVP